MKMAQQIEEETNKFGEPHGIRTVVVIGALFCWPDTKYAEGVTALQENFKLKNKFRQTVSSGEI